MEARTGASAPVDGTITTRGETRSCVDMDAPLDVGHTSTKKSGGIAPGPTLSQ
jgi:hypothetical protein